MLTAVQELSQAVGWSTHRGPSSVLVSVLVIGSQLPPEPAFQEDQARAAWCVMVHHRSHTDALALHSTEHSGRKAAGFKGRGHRADLQVEERGDGDAVVAASGRSSLLPFSWEAADSS